MIVSRLKQGILFSFLFVSVAAHAVTNWQIDPKQSNLTFTATQNGSPVNGEFKTFSGDIAFDPLDLTGSHIKIIVDVASVMSSYAEVADTLKTADWFNIKLFPQAVFEASHFIKTGDKTYQATGMLTLRDKSQPLVLDFMLDNDSNGKARASGSTSLSRTQFGVGQGEWAKTDAVKDDVKVQFVVVATKKS